MIEPEGFGDDPPLGKGIEEHGQKSPAPPALQTGVGLPQGDQADQAEGGVKKGQDQNTKENCKENIFRVRHFSLPFSKSETGYPQITQISQRAKRYKCYDEESLYNRQSSIMLFQAFVFILNASYVFIRVHPRPIQSFVLVLFQI
jgi:hypothetical protein